ncbi:orc-2, partial [Pristionchus pacificus]
FTMESRSPSRKRTDVLPHFDESMTTPPKQPRPSRNATPTRTPKAKMMKQVEAMSVDSDDNIPVVRKRKDEEAENRKPFVNEMPEETVSVSAIENYFLKGKNVQQNKKRRRKQKKDRRGERGNDSQEEEEDDEEKEEEDEGDKRYEECDLNALRKFHEQSHQLEAEVVEKLGKQHFDKWTLYLATGFNILVHGLGSIRPLLHDYAERMGREYTVVEVEGFRPECSPRNVLTTIYDLLHLKFQKRRSLIEFARQMAEAVTDRDVILVIHNMDDPPFRAEGDMEVLAILAASAHYHIVASAQHVNRMLLWNMRSVASFNWKHEHVNTDLPMQAEIFAGASTLLGLCSAESVSTHTISSLEVLWLSLNDNARAIFHAIFSLVYGTEPDAAAKSVSFWDLFNLCKDEFWVSSDAALRQQLVEFCDHRLIRTRRGNDGNEKIYATADRVIIDRFLKSVNKPLVEMQVGEDGEDE